MAQLPAGAGELAHRPDAIDPEIFHQHFQRAIALLRAHAGSAVGTEHHTVDGLFLYVALGAGGASTHVHTHDAGDSGIVMDARDLPRLEHLARPGAQVSAGR